MMDRNSIDAYRSTDGLRDDQRTLVLSIIRQARHPSSADVARLSGLPRTSVCGRIRELEKDGLIYKANTKIDPFTKKTVNYYMVKQ